MQPLQQSFDELRQRLKQGRRLHYAGDDPVYYIIFPPQEMLEVKKQVRQWEAKLTLEGWTVHTFSMAEAVKEILNRNELRDLWLESEKEDPLDFDSINKTLADALTADDALKNMLGEKLESLANESKAILFCYGFRGSTSLPQSWKY